MKWVNNFESFQIDDVNEDDIKIEQYNDFSYLIHENERAYLMINRNFTNKFERDVDKSIETETTIINISTNSKIRNSNLYYDYGDNNSIIIDMNGIDNFRFAVSEVFNDYTIRKIVKKLKLLPCEGQYLRVGASGARKNGNHPGGEVFEYSLLDSNMSNGVSQTISGYLPEGKRYSKSVPLYNKEHNKMLEERIVYSHTAWLRKCPIEDSKSICLKIKALKDNLSLLDIFNEIASDLELNCFSIQIYVRPKVDNEIKVIGRVLKHMPEHAFKDIPEVVKISYEKEFELSTFDRLYGLGTKYERYEPEWKEFTNGGKYERRGHIHATIISDKKTGTEKHETFHLRDILISPNSEVEVILTPIDKIYRIYPIHKENGNYIIDSSKKNINDIIENIKSVDKKEQI